MLNPNERYVVRNPDGGWDVKAAHAKRSSKRSQTQAEAIQHGKEIVRNAGGGEVRIQGRDGRFRNSDAVAPGSGLTHPRTLSTDVVHAAATAQASSTITLINRFGKRPHRARGYQLAEQFGRQHETEYGCRPEPQPTGKSKRPNRSMLSTRHCDTYRRTSVSFDASDRELPR